MNKRIKKFAVIAGLAVSGLVGIYATSAKDDFFEISKNLEIFATLYRELNVYYVDEIQPGEMMKTGIDAMLESLDPYTTYITESNIEDYRFMTTGQYGGIGSLIRSVDGDVYISEPYEGFPAYDAGLKAGDKILDIDGKSIKDKNQEEISKLLKGQSGTKLSITYERQGKVETTELERAEVKIPDVPYFGMLEDNIGYISLSSFTRTASKEVREAFQDLKKKGMTKLVFDLRGNGGGLLNEAVNIVNFFVPKGQEVVSTKGKIPEWDRTHYTLNAPLDTVMPLVILVNERSASASEIVSGALQDLDRAIVIGSRTYGKGLVQQTKDLQYNNKLKLTVAKYYIPSGRCIQKLDYANKDKDGKAEEVPDSLLKVFYTDNGREVMDGRGIDPDVEVETPEFPHIVGSLLSESLFFNYATQYSTEHSTIPPAATFNLSDEEYEAFMVYLQDKNYSYTTDTEKEMKELIKTAKKEKYWKMSEAEFNQLDESLNSKKNQDLIIYKDEINEILTNEIVSRYYYQQGRIESSLSWDDVLEVAVEVLENGPEYQKILSPS